MDFVTLETYGDRAFSIMDAARRVGAVPTDIPGLWHVPGYPELTTMQMLQVAETKEPSAYRSPMT
jgi:hypothetical protein